jgi:hypothetical protein
LRKTSGDGHAADSPWHKERRHEHTRTVANIDHLLWPQQKHNATVWFIANVVRYKTHDPSTLSELDYTEYMRKSLVRHTCQGTKRQNLRVVTGDLLKPNSNNKIKVRFQRSLLMLNKLQVFDRRMISGENVDKESTYPSFHYKNLSRLNLFKKL